MRITILSSSSKHPIYTLLRKWVENNKDKHDINLINSKSELGTGEILFLISCNEIISLEERQLYNKTLIIHASDLPEGRGWSPHIWQIINGANKLVVTLLEAEDAVDSGDIWHQLKIEIPKDALWYEINQYLFNAELELMDFTLNNYDHIHPRSQSKLISPTYYSKRSPSDSEIDPYMRLSDQFDLIRVCDPERFPAFFKLHGQKYKIFLEKLVDE